jgi:hypothetical protein
MAKIKSDYLSEDMVKTGAANWSKLVTLRVLIPPVHGQVDHIVSDSSRTVGSRA